MLTFWKCWLKMGFYSSTATYECLSTICRGFEGSSLRGQRTRYSFRLYKKLLTDLKISDDVPLRVKRGRSHCSYFSMKVQIFVTNGSTISATHLLRNIYFQWP